VAVSAISQYQIHDGGRDAFLNAARETSKLSESLGNRTTLRATVIGGELTGVQSLIDQFPNAVARGAYIDAVTQPENIAKNALVQLQRSGGVTLVSRIFLDETPATEELPTASQVLGVFRVRIAPGRLAEGEAALLDAKSLRQSFGIESHTYTVGYGGASQGVRLLTTHATTHRELAESQGRLVARTEGRGPIPIAIDSGALILVGASISVLIAL
jgi:hypothetical protein